ncbi:MAG: nucleotidyltransferase domain-containing protein [Thermodesulfobacteriota bacterium]|nr:nucleotidyltransferase domain-containing protein [Thermodesulfobacteriota bacterium]
MTESTQKITKILKQNRQIEFAYLFGSRVKNTAGKKSDWDIAVFFKKNPEHLPAWYIFRLEAEIAREINENVQITALNNLHSPIFLFQIIHDGWLLIDHKPEVRVIFEAGVLRKYHYWSYFLKRQMIKK